MAWHSLSIRTDSGSYGEGDFIIAAPEWGFLVLEVKGGAVTERDGAWYQNAKRLREGPLAQAHKFRSKFHVELRRVYERYEVEGKCAVCLPDVAADNRPTNSDYRDILIDQSQLGDIVSCLRLAFESQFTPGNAPPNRDWMDAITQLWGDAWQPTLGLMGHARMQKHEREQLDKRQLDVIRGLEENQLVVVSAVPVPARQPWQPSSRASGRTQNRFDTFASPIPSPIGSKATLTSSSSTSPAQTSRRWRCVHAR